MKRRQERTQLTEAHKKKIYLFAIIVALIFIAAVGYLTSQGFPLHLFLYLT